MANRNEKHPENAPGAWYVDSSCVICGLCGEYAPANFRVAADTIQNIVYRQPSTPEELAAAQEVKESCPTDSIGNDGAGEDLE